MTFNNWQNVVQDQCKLQPWRVPDLCRRREGQGLMQGTVFLQMLKGQCHEILCDFFISWKEAIWAPDKQANMVLLKKSFSRRYSQKIRLRAVLACTELNSAQANSAQDNSAESNKFFRFSNIFISREYRIHMKIFQKNLNIFRKSKLDNTARVRVVRLCAG